MKNRLPIVTILMLSSAAACNETVGDCWPVGQNPGSGGVIDSSGSGAGAGTSGDEPTGQAQQALGMAQCNASDSSKTSGGTSAAPPESAGSGGCDTAALSGLGGTQNADGTSFWACSGPCANNCPAEPQMGWISPDAFHFVTILPDDGLGSAGGWQAAPAVLKFKRWTGFLPEAWTCPQFTIGMPLRTQFGVISPSYAASVSAAVANVAMDNIMHPPGGGDPLPGVACSQLKPTMQQIFNSVYGILGAKLTTP